MLVGLTPDHQPGRPTPPKLPVAAWCPLRNALTVPPRFCQRSRCAHTHHLSRELTWQVTETKGRSLSRLRKATGSHMSCSPHEAHCRWRVKLTGVLWTPLSRPRQPLTFPRIPILGRSGWWGHDDRIAGGAIIVPTLSAHSTLSGRRCK